VRACLIFFAFAWAAWSAPRCPWLNAATAAGVLGGSVTSVTVTDDSCNFTRQDGSRVSELRIETQVLHSPAADFRSYASRCPAPTTPLKAIGNEALLCSSGDFAQVIGRVRERGFIVSISTKGTTPDPDTLRDKARQVAEQVAGILF
jgi:hypothetical protein